MGYNINKSYYNKCTQQLHDNVCYTTIIVIIMYVNNGMYNYFSHSAVGTKARELGVYLLEIT